ncbi:MAG: CPBP family intramembrane glutamic endopeptidase [Flavobacteriaceae bacterium]
MKLIKEKQTKIYTNVLLVFFAVFSLMALIHIVLNHFDTTSIGILKGFIVLTGGLVGLYVFVKQKNLLKIEKVNVSDIFIIVFLLGLFVINNLIFDTNSFGYKGISFLLLLDFTIISIGEELFYRGFVQTYINENTINKKMISNGNIFATILMTLTHIGFFSVLSPLFATTSLLLVIIFSLTAGYFRDKTKGIIIPVIVHLLVNLSHLYIPN